MKKIALILTSLIVLSAVPAVYAHDKEKEREREEEFLSLQVEEHDKDEDENDDEGEFSIKGIIEAVGTNSFVVNGQTILIDVSQVEEFKQKGILVVGARVKVEGEVIGDSYYAEEIKIIGEGQGRFQFKVNGVFVSISPTPTPSASPTVSPTPTGSPEASGSPTPSVSPTPTATSNVTVQVKAVGPIELVTSFLEQVLAYLQGLLS